MSFNQRRGYARYVRTAIYMYNEMTTNINSTDANSIRDDLKTARVANSMGMIPAAQYASALLTWYNAVKSGAKWDHKPEIIRRNNLRDGDNHFPIYGDTTHEWFYDIWSNIHYGYVGTSVGFSESTLIGGANAGEIFGAGGNDPIDDAMARIGIRMWQNYGANITQHTLANEVVARKNWLLDVQETKVYTDARGSFRHIMPMSQGNSR